MQKILCHISKNERIIDKPISRPLYLHFFDKELLESVGQQRYSNKISETFRRDFLLCLMATKEKAYMSIAQIFDNYVANALFKRYPKLFNSYGCIELWSGVQNLEELFISKREQYPKKEGGRDIYWKEDWEIYEQNDPNLILNENNTTILLSQRLEYAFQFGHLYEIAKKSNIKYNVHELKKQASYMEDILLNREKKAITKYLYADYLKTVPNTKEMSTILIREISQRYLEIYMGYKGGTIATGLTCQLNYYDEFTDTFPYYDIRIWRRIYELIGCIDFLLDKAEDNVLLKIRRDSRYARFIDQIRNIIGILDDNFCSKIASPIIHINYTGLNKENKRVDYICNNLQDFCRGNKKDITSGEQVLELMEKVTININKKVAQERRKNVMTKNIDPRNVFVIYGRNLEIKKDFFDLLRSVDLKPYEWQNMVALTGVGSPTNYESIDQAMDTVQAFIALFTPDDIVELKKDFITDGKEDKGEQPRPNVLFETGLAFGKDRKKTIIVEVGDIRPITDLSGFNTVRLDGTLGKRKDLFYRLKTLGCEMDLSSTDWESKKYSTNI